MRIVIGAIGRLKAGPESQLCARYRDRFDATARQLGLGRIELIELPESRASRAPDRCADEAARLLQKLPSDRFTVVLDETGTTTDSPTFASWIAHNRDNGAAAISFLIGGPDGHGAAIGETADKTLNFGQMTLPHGLARVVLFEQLYRAATILSGHPYHRS